MGMMDNNMTMSDSDFSKLRAIVHQKTGITIGEARKSMLISRLRSRLRDTDTASFGAYISKISTDPDETQELINRVTTNETYFYRTPRVWSYFREVCLPHFHGKGANRPMRVWSAAASTGEEAHTIAVLLEAERQTHERFDFSVLGTDVSSRVLKIAEEGLYNGKSIARFKKEDPDLFATQMTGNDEDGYRVSAKAKSRIKFRRHNLMESLKNERMFDVVFLRNVLIYFSPEDQQKVLKLVHDQLSPDGILFVGESETLGQIETDFESVSPLIYRPTPPARGPST